MAVPMETDKASGCIHNYVVTAQKPTAVTHAITGHFTSPTDINLIVAKATRVEISTVVNDGLQGVLDFPIYGRVSTLQLFRPKGASKDLLFILTERYKFCVLEYNAAAGELVTRAAGDVQDKIGKPCDNGQIGRIDPDCRMIGLHLYDGMFKVIPLDESGALQEAFNLRLEELAVVDLAFLAGCPRPTIAVLYEDTKHARHVKTYEVVVKDKDFIEGPWSQQNVDAGASLLLPLPRPQGGVLVLGESVVTYFSGAQPFLAVPIRQTIMRAAGMIDEDGSRWLLGDHAGQLYLLVLATDGERVAGLKVQPLGRTASASALCYLDQGVAYVGSRVADSQLVRLRPEPVPGTEPPSYVEVLDSFTNLGPIVDMALVDLDRQGQGQVVTCSGVFHDGSLRIVRSGIGICEAASVELQGIRGVWSLRRAWADAYDTYLVLAFVGETRVLAINPDDELDEADVEGFDSSAQSLLCATTRHDGLLQVTAAGVRLAAGAGGQLLATWAPPPGSSISVASSSPTQVLVATGGGHLVLLHVGARHLCEVAHVALGAEVACVDISPLGDAGGAAAATLAAVGTWDMRLLLLSLPDLKQVHSEALGGEVIPRSVLLCCLQGCRYLMCGMGDGSLLTWRAEGAEGGRLADRKKLSLGTKPILLRTFASSGASHVFAASDRPTIIYSHNRKLLYSNLNASEVNFMASFHAASFPNSLAIAKEGDMTIGSIDEIQKLHIRSVPLREQPRRIAHQEQTKSLGVLTISMAGGAGGMAAADVHQLRVLDAVTFDVEASYTLEEQEMGTALASAQFAGDPAVYYVVGTAHVVPDEAEPSKGRLLVLQYSEGRLALVAEKETKGAVYQVLPFQGKLLAAVNSRVHLHRWAAQEGGGPELVAECSHHGHVVALYLAARGDFILVGDLMKSVSLLLYKPEEGTLEVRARDYSSTWTTAVAVLDDDTFLVAENSYNLYMVRKNSDSASDEERNRLEVVGCYHLGGFVNRFQHGCLVMRMPDSELAQVPTLLYGTVDGALGLVASLPRDVAELLSRLQDALRQVIKGVGGLDHGQWRSYSSERRVEAARGFLDGDLIEQLLDLAPAQQRHVVGLMGPDVAVEDVCRLVEELARLH